MKNIQKVIIYRIALIISAVLFIGSTTFGIITLFKNDLLGDYTTFFTLGTFISAIIFAGFVFLFYHFHMEQYRFIEELKNENEYSLGHDTAFYNLAAFKQNVIRKNRKKKFQKKNIYIFVFTATSSQLSNNFVSNVNVAKLNYSLSKFIANTFSKKKETFNRKNIVYGFNRGSFLIAAYLDDSIDFKDLISIISNETYKIVNEEKLKIWAQPFFGIKEYKTNENITSAIEDAFVARNLAESNFESFMIYSKSSVTISNNSEIIEALNNDEFIPYYQPKYSLKEKKFISCEVLARWNSPSRGIVPPGLFIEQAEQAGILPQIDLIMFEKGLNDLSEAIRRGRRVLPCSFNFSLYEFFSHNFLDTLTGLIDKYKVPTNLIEIEITETTSQINQFLSVSVIKKLKKMGIRVLMDDYGVGYSQIDNFNKIPFDGIKIDKSFTDDLLNDEKSKSIVKFLIELGHANNMEVIIEGVEKKEQVDVLRKMHIDTIQGFYYSKGLSLSDLQEFLAKNDFEKEIK